MLSTHGYFDPVPQLGRTDTGGQVVYVLELAKALAKRGIKTDIYTRWCEPEKPQFDPVPGHPDVRVVRILCCECAFTPKEQIYEFLPELAQNMVELIKKEGLDYDLYHGHYVDAGIVTLDVAKAFDKPAFFTAHSLGAWKRQQMAGNPDEMEKKYNFAHRISEEMRIFESVVAQTVTTDLQREKLKELYGFEANNIAVIPPGVDVERFHPLDDEPSLRGVQQRSNLVNTNFPGKYIFCLSRIDTNKGHDFLLYAFDIVRKRVPDVQLVIGGGSPKPGPREQEVFAMMHKIIEEREMGDRVSIIGYVPDEALPSFYRDAELFTLPSIFEPFGMTAIEAMACKTPVVASKFGGIKNVIDSGENGILVDPANAGEFAEAMIGLLQNKENAERLAANGRKKIVEEYSWDAIARKHIEFYGKYMGD